MRVIRLISPGKALELAEIPMASPSPGEVVVRVRAAGICHSDAHYRAGRSSTGPLPLTLGHEVSGIIEECGPGVNQFEAGDRVCVHYLATCGNCAYCHQGNEQFCVSGQMIGKQRDGGYAEFLAVPARSVLRLPDEIPFDQGAIMMCSTATSLHALNKARIKAGDSVAVFGIGGLGLSAIQLARAFGATEVFAVDIKQSKLDLARNLGATPVNATVGDPVEQIRQRTSDRGVDVALELVGLPLTMKQAIESLAIKGRAALVGITDQPFSVVPYHELINKEAEIIGVSDHLAQELPLLLEWCRQGKLDFSHVITRSVGLDPKAVNEVLDELESFGDEGRVVIVP
jgi:2-desacetyl-2-hydroxyethyl bacteriochlorophyllide A dehydrogenase